MESIPLYIYFNNQAYFAILNSVSGAAGRAVYHLMIDNYYFGTLIFTGKWAFHGRIFTEIAEELGSFLAVIE